MKPEEFFVNKQQLERYHYAVELGMKLKQYQDDGYLLFDEDYNLITGEIVFNTDFGAHDFDIVSIKNEIADTKYALTIQIGIEYDSMGYPWLASKKQMKSAHSHITNHR